MRPVPEASALNDVQADADRRGIAIEKAGIKNLALPLRFLDADGAAICSEARASAWSALPPDQRGAHMSRLVTSLGKWKDGVALFDLPAKMRDLASEMESDTIGVRLSFNFFLERATPVSGLHSWNDCKAAIEAILDDGNLSVSATVEVPVTTLCPCSKEVSKTGAHSQRSQLSVTVGVNGKAPSLRDLAERLEGHASARIDAVLKREDEKHVTEGAYDSPRFAEDLAREVAADLASDKTIGKWSVSVRNMESIHNHDVFAATSSDQT